MKGTIEVIISPHGETRVETKGFSGTSCRDASAALEAALGQRTFEQPTPEFYQSVDTASHVHQEDSP